MVHHWAIILRKIMENELLGHPKKVIILHISRPQCNCIVLTIKDG
jgi:hypothetical protein